MVLASDNVPPELLLYVQNQSQEVDEPEVAMAGSAGWEAAGE